MAFSLPTLKKIEPIYIPGKTKPPIWRNLFLLIIFILFLYLIRNWLLSLFFIVSPGTVTTDKVIIYAPYNGYVYHLRTSPHQAVKVNDTMLDLDSPDLKEQIKSLQASLNHLIFLKSRQQPEQQSIYNQDIAQIRHHLMDLLAANSQSEIKTPIDGVVTTIYIQNRQFVRQGTPLMEISNSKNWQIHALLNKKDIAHLHPEKKVWVLFPDYRVIPGYISNQLNLPTNRQKTLFIITLSKPIPGKYKVEGLEVRVIF